MRRFVKGILLGTMAFSSIASAKQDPNVIIILLDDMGYGDLSLTGSQGHLTPAIDKLGKEGLFFSHFYAAQPVSSASRIGLLTGCYPNRLGFSGAIMPHDTVGISPDLFILPELFKEKGYYCGAIGKWHVGHKKESLPLQNGFDEYLGLPYSNDMWPVGFDGKPVSKDSESSHKSNYPVLALLDGNEVVSEIRTLEDQARLTTIYTERAVRFIRSNKERPFFLYMAHSMPHVPLAVSDKFKGKSKRGLYGDVMMEIDWSVESIMNALKECGIDDNTLVIFTSDNGPWLTFGDHAGSSGGLREGKLTSFEGGLRVPCLMWWRNVIPAGRICNQLVSSLDLFPTLAALLDIDVSSCRLDGVDITSLMSGKSRVSPRENFLYYYKKNDLEAVRNERYKLVFPHDYMTCDIPGRNGFRGDVRKLRAEMALYDLFVDPGERCNIIEEYPEVVSSLLKIAEDARMRFGDNLK